MTQVSFYLCYLLNAKGDRTMFMSLNGKHL